MLTFWGDIIIELKLSVNWMYSLFVCLEMDKEVDEEENNIEEDGKHGSREANLERKI